MTTRSSEFVRLGLRWRKRMALVFVLITGAAIWYAAVSDREYASVMKIVVKRERSDPLVGPDQAYPEQRSLLTEEELNGEVELLKSDEVLAQVVTAVGLNKSVSDSFWRRLWAPSTEQIREEKALRRLSAHLDITLPRKSNIIRVSYRSSDPEQAKAVLTALSRFYIDKHTAVHRSGGQFEFFARQTDLYRKRLEEAEQQLAGFPSKAGIVAGREELDIAVKELGALQAARAQTQTAIQEIRQRIDSLQRQLSSTPARMTTAVKTADNQYLMMQLKNTLLSLELKRTELLKKYEPGYRDVVEVDRQISQTRDAITAAEKSPLRDETTDRDPTFEWMRAELARGRTELIGLTTRAHSQEQAIASYEQRARRLNVNTIQQQDLIRTAKALEENYALYLRKREQARISDALDRNRILNVALAQNPTLPALPVQSPVLIVLQGLVLATVLSVGTAFTSEFLQPQFRTAEDVEAYLGVPVLAILPPSRLPDGSGTRIFLQ